MITLCYLFIYVFEQFISYIYFSNKFYLKRDKKLVVLLYTLSFIAQFLIHHIQISELNLISFFVCNFLIVTLCFNCSFKQSFFNTLLLEAVMISSELVVMYFTSFVLQINLNQYLFDDSIIILETVCTKTLYFLLTYFISRLSRKEKKDISKYDKSFFLFCLPIVSIGIIISFTYLSISYDVNNTTKLLFSIISLVLLGTNLIVFFTHEKIMNVLTENISLQLENQKNKINDEYYHELEKQQDTSNLLIHDIKRCLINIQELSVQGDTSQIIEYIDSIYNGYKIQTLKQYSNNKLINIIVSRYAQLFANDNIDFSVDIRNVDFSFIDNSDITALLDNLLENSYDAVKISKRKIIDLTIDKQNEKYVIIQLSNSSDIKPEINNKSIKTTKKDIGMHGIGTKSILRIVKRYSGNLEWEYNDILGIFTATIILKTI